ncbi:yippee zinc-binding/DNA-binding /Mis18, centromere assembly-domain-containing protein [Sporodiniella umbellata]|nr:yippee zinc-binding/DNA-binding /Mis18, centromere assembly-domain-containing protein [Sporodiniella umbellata]
MGLSYRHYLDESASIYACRQCETHLSSSENVISRQFHGQHGQAFLFEQVVNVDYGKAQDRHMSSGLHRVKDVFCTHCLTLIGWTYVKAFTSVNKYKEGKFVLEKKLLMDLSDKVYLENRLETPTRRPYE